MNDKKVVWWKTIFASYNPLDDKIRYCQKGSLQYLHEERHRQQLKDGLLNFVYEWSFFIGLILTVLLTNWIFSVPAFIFTITLELDAWQYSLRKRYGKKKKV